MTYFFRLALMDTPTPPFRYRGEVHGVHEVFLILDEEQREVRAADADGNPVGSLRMSLKDGSLSGTSAELSGLPGFPSMAAHLLARWKKQGGPPQEIQKFFT